MGSRRMGLQDVGVFTAHSSSPKLESNHMGVDHSPHCSSCLPHPDGALQSAEPFPVLCYPLDVKL